MSSYLGDFAEDATVHFLWSSFDADGGSITRTVDGTISVYKDNGLTQSTAGITEAEDFDGVTGIHSCTIDLSADAFYATGSNYSVVLSGATIDGETVNAVLREFSIENRFMRGTDGANTTTPPTAAAIRAEMDSNSTQLAAIVADTNELQSDDVPGLIAALDAVVDTVKAETALIVADTNELQTDDVPGLIAALDAVVDTVKAETALIVADTNELQTDDIPGLLAAIDTLIDGIKAKTDDLTFTVANAVDVNLTNIEGSSNRVAKFAEGLDNTLHGDVVSATDAENFVIQLLDGDTEDATDDTYNGRFLTFTNGVNIHQTGKITDYNGTTKAVVFASGSFTGTPSAGDDFVIT